MPPIKVIPRPQPVDVLQWTGDNLAELNDFVHEHVIITDNGDGTLSVNDGMGAVLVVAGGYLMRGSVFGNPIEHFQEVPAGPLAFEIS